MSSAKKYIVLASILFIISVFFFSYYVAPTLISYWENPYYPYKYKIYLGIIAPYAILKHPYEWDFRYYPANTSFVPPTPAEIRVSNNVTGNAQYFNATVGAAYTWEGMKFKVLEVYPAIATLLVKPET